MFAPNEIANKKFDKTVGFGYKIDHVEEYLGEVANYIAQISEEKQDLEKKLEFLADKLEEYRQDEDSLRSALLGAQKLGDGVIRESKTKAEIIMRDATIKAEKMVDSARRQIEQEQMSLTKMQKEVANFKNRLFALYRQHLELIGALPGDEEPPKVEQRPKEQANTTDSQEQEPAQKAQKQTKQEYQEEPQSHTPPKSTMEEERRTDEKTHREFFKIDFAHTSHDVDDDGDTEPATEKPPMRRAENRFGGPMKFGEGFELVREDEGSARKRR